MRLVPVLAAGVLAVGLGSARAAMADDVSDVKAELEAMKQRIAAQDRKIRELENKAPTQDEIAAAVGRYLESTPASAYLVGGADAAGSAGWPQGGAPFIQQGPNKINFHLRNQVRYEGFLYSDHAVGVAQHAREHALRRAARATAAGFEIERLYFGFDGSVFCPDITFQLTLNFDTDTGGRRREGVRLDRLEVLRREPRAGRRRQGAVHVRGAELLGCARLRRPVDGVQGVRARLRHGRGAVGQLRLLRVPEAVHVQGRREHRRGRRRAGRLGLQHGRVRHLLRPACSSPASSSGRSPARTGSSTRSTTVPATSGAGWTRASASARTTRTTTTRARRRRARSRSGRRAR